MTLECLFCKYKDRCINIPPFQLSETCPKPLQFRFSEDRTQGYFLSITNITLRSLQALFFPVEGGGSEVHVCAKNHKTIYKISTPYPKCNLLVSEVFQTVQDENRGNKDPYKCIESLQLKITPDL